MSKASMIFENNIISDPVVVAAGDTLVLDVRGCVRFMGVFENGVHTYVKCDEDGTAVDGATAHDFNNEEALDVEWSRYLITADANNTITVDRV